ncbi:50S ribosomal protein L10, partial [Patescibacteria group bacterium]|nr:50S ribosomal protein L10 [Patescibacteria group bacterium]
METQIFVFHYMPKTKAQKQSILQQIAENLKNQQSVLFVDFKGIGVKDLSKLRSQLKEVGAKLEVAKKTLLARAFKENGLDTDFKNMEGQIAVIYS